MLNLGHRYLLTTIVLLLGVTAVCYGKFVENYFAFDDFAIMEHVLRGPAVVLQGYNYILRLVFNAIHWPLYFSFGLNPLGYNLFSLTLHLINAIVLFIVVRMLFDNYLYATLSAILFVGSSVGCDALFWKAAYATPLNLAFYLCTIFAYLIFRKEGKTGYFILSVGLFILAILSKEEAASLPFVILLIEVLVLGSRFDFTLIRKTIPYCVVIILYLLANYILIYHVFKGESELVRHSGFRPLHTFFSPWTVFFIPPHGRLDGQLSAMIITTILLPMSLVFCKDRRIIIFAMAWVFVTFLPQSLSTLSQFEPKYIFNSISRHLYLPSVGAAMFFAAIIVHLREGMRPYIGRCFVMLAVIIFLYFNYGRIQSRGSQWANEGRPIKAFLSQIGKVMPSIPDNSHFLVKNSPTGRAYTQLAMRVYYRNPNLWWIVDPRTYEMKPNEPVFVINCEWNSPDDVSIVVKRLN